MKIIQPDKKEWASICERQALTNEKSLDSVRDILRSVKENGDQALKELTEKFDGIRLSSLEYEIQSQEISLPPELENAIQLAIDNIKKYHQTQIKEGQRIETSKGVECWWENRPIEKVGLYIPGGSAPLFSTLLMLVVPAQLAGCQNIVICTPPDKDGKPDSAIIRTAQILGIGKIYTVGGAQAIAAMAYGTETIPKTDKIFGPGNSFVTMAKQLIQQEGVAIDLPAGPSEVLIIADETANPSYVAADLLSQAEHGPDSQVVLLSTSQTFIDFVLSDMDKQLAGLPRRDIAEKALENSFALVLNNIEECFEFSNLYAPEHLILALDDAENYLSEIQNAGSVFVGHLASESAGDYASGTNHTLPTSGFARAYSGVGVESFQKRISFQKVSNEGIKNIGPAVISMAEAEGLQAHANAMQFRLNVEF